MNTQTNKEKAMNIIYDVAKNLKASMKVYDDAAEIFPLYGDYSICLHFETGCGVPEKPVMELEFGATTKPLPSEDKKLLLEQLKKNCTDSGFYDDGYSTLRVPSLWAVDTVPVDHPDLAVETICNMAKLWEKLLQKSWDIVRAA